MQTKFFRSSCAALAVALLASGCQSETENEAVEDDAVPPPPQIVSAQLQDAEGNARGEAVIAEGDENLLLTLTVEGVEPGTHGVHIHTTGQCEGPDFTSAGGHWNPADREHGLENEAGAHAGDLPNLEVAADGTGRLEATIENASLMGSDIALLDADGAAFIIHAGEDDQLTDPSGDSGARIACGVFLPQ